MYNLLDPETEKTYGANLCSGDPLSTILSILPAIGGAMGEVGSVLGPIGSALGAVNSAVSLGENLFGGGKSNAPTQAAPAAPTPAQPTTSPTDFKNNESAYWNQLLAGTGIAPTGQLPDSIQQNIDRQASLLG